MKELGKYSREADVAVLRLAFNLVPYVGPVLNELVFDIRGRVKQDRLNKFTEMFAEYFIGKPEFDTDALRTEDFGDLFEAVINHVIQTKSEAKHIRYRDILIKKIENTLPDENNSARYLDLVSILNESEIAILDSHRVFDEHYKQDSELLESFRQQKTQLMSQYRDEFKLSIEGHANNKSQVKDNITLVEDGIVNLEAELLVYDVRREAHFYNISEKQFLYYKQNLYSKALLIDSATGGDSYGYTPFAAMGITEFGKEFLEFLINKK
ncbi:hypothetical protein SAMN02745146_2720 [Hymenobacter daecheongensis DSM 21074]|uniref:Uncharacterized protein n=1 Tax=Hymenobacter daecheongensis DSM 21074 TaxID=1121955 RepID=A0A1M6HZL9_9BACT|nr:hypothetical protein [Hymenobacter daecheongensis]SHJ27627.1 hypothetical protein SAMN02745146_2720 [Hymenobacter daecheongensis DSM 21074]